MGILSPEYKSEKMPEMPLQLLVAGTFTLQPLEPALRFWSEEMSLPINVTFSPYAQVLQELLHSSSQLRTNTRGMNVVLVRLADWQIQSEHRANELIDSPGHRSTIEENTSAFIDAARSAAPQLGAPLLVIICPSGSETTSAGMETFLQSLGHRIEQELVGLPGVDVVSAETIQDLYPVADYRDPQANELAHVPYTGMFFSILGTIIARKLHMLFTPPCKVIMVDADNTLWNGVCGEDGPDGIQIDADFRAFQEYLIQQTDAGRLVCVVSKNNEEDVRAVFQSRTDMLLELKHVTAISANWGHKSESIQKLAQTLNLGLDSVVFFDDDPVVCAEVKSNCPAVLTFQLPDDTERRMAFINHLWALDKISQIQPAHNRTALYHDQFQREQFRERSLSLVDFLAGLNLDVEVKPISEAHLERVAELTHRTNQFNCMVKRRTAAEIRRVLSSDAMFGSVVHVRDRFGDYGLVGVLIYAVGDDSLIVDTMLLSCRTLGRGVEHEMVAFLGRQAKISRVENVILPFVSTPKNQPAKDFLHSIASEFPDRRKDRVQFVLPASIASELSYQPTELQSNEHYPESGKHGEPELATGDLDQQERAEQLQSIALYLSDPDQIHDAVTSMNVVERDTSTPFVAPATEIEQQILDICAEAIGVNRLGMHDNFFTLGIHSLLIMQIIARIQELFDIDLPIQTFFLTSTAAGISQALVEQFLAEEQGIDAIGLSEAVTRLATEDFVVVADKSSSLVSETAEIASSGPDLVSTDNPDRGESRYRLSSISITPGGAGEQLIYSPESRMTVSVPTEFVDVLRREVRFSSRDKLAEQMIKVSTTQTERDSAQATLDQLIDANLAISESAFIEKMINIRSESSDRPGITVFGIGTGNRPKTLQRGLESYLQNFQDHGKQVHSMIINDSDNPQVCHEYQERLRTVKDKFKCAITYAGPDERQRYMVDLSREGDIPASVIEFALKKPSHLSLHHSGNRNALLLASVGELTFSVDDDTLCEAVASPDGSSGLGLTSGADPSEYWFFPNRSRMQGELATQPVDVLEKLAGLLGKDPAFIATHNGDKDQIAVHKVSDELLRRLTTPHSKVTLAFPGLNGDCAWGAPFGFWGAPMGFMLMEGSSHTRLTHTEDDYRRFCTSREILRVTPTATLCDASFSMTTFFGMDNREMLPPHFPLGRASDMLFGWTTWHSLPHSLVGHAPWSLRHAPADQRKFNEGEILRTASAFDLGKVLFACMEAHQWSAINDNPAERLNQLGIFLMDLGRLSPDAFDDFMRVAALQYNSRFATMIEERLDTSKATPDYWAKELKQFHTLLRKSELRDDYWVPLDLASAVSMSAAKELTPKYIFQFGELLCWWPAMRDAAQSLKSKGRNLGAPV